MLEKTNVIALASLFVLTAFTGCLGSDDEVTPTEKLIVAYEVKEDYENPDENPQILADFLASKLDMEVELYPVTTEGSILEALRFGNAHIAFMDGAAAWMGWQQYNLDALAADKKSDGRTYYEGHAWVKSDSEMAAAFQDNDTTTDPFALLEGKTSCHTGWLKSAGMLLPMGYLISNGYADIVGDVDDIESLRDTIYTFFNENASIPDSGTPYYGYEGAVKCLSEGVGDVAFAKDSTVDGYCNNDNASDNKDWCLPRDEYVALPAFGKAPSHPVMFNPEYLNGVKKENVMNALLALNNEMYVVDYAMGGETYTGCYDMATHQVNNETSQNACGDNILANIIGTSGIVETNAQDHLGSYGSLVGAIPGINTYFDSKYEITS
tara:strand:+ start:407 stop:1546 length:1140 start_codon:yes stop_codon:yes gene_type:complete